MRNSVIDIYSINQIIDILLWSWIFLIMIKRSICKKFIPPIKFIELLKHHHYFSDILLLLASITAVCQFSNQLYSHITNTISSPNMLNRTLIWMFFHKLVTIAILVKYRNSQPKIFYTIVEEVKQLKFY